MQKLADAAKAFGGSCIAVQFKLGINAYCSQTDESLSITAIREPDELLKGIDEWNQADEQSAGLE